MATLIPKRVDQSPAGRVERARLRRARWSAGSCEPRRRPRERHGCERWKMLEHGSSVLGTEIAKVCHPQP
jgi:hypothetical protein